MEVSPKTLKELEQTPALAEEYNRLRIGMDGVIQRLAGEVAARQGLPPALVSGLLSGSEFARWVLVEELPREAPPAWKTHAPESRRDLMGFLEFFAAVRRRLEETPEYREYNSTWERLQKSLEDVSRVLEDLSPPE